MALVGVGGGHTLSPEAAASWGRMARGGMPTGGLTSSTRSLARQWDLYNNRGKPGWPKYAAHPLESKHVWRPDDKKDRGGRAVDVNEPTRSWLVKNGAAHGWHRPFAAVEPWHFEYDITKDKHLEDDVALEDSDIRKIVRAVWAEEKSVGKSAGDTLGTRSPSAMLMIQQATYARRDAREGLARTKAIEAAINKGTSVSAKDVARELRPLISADIRAAVAGLPAQQADRIADAVLAAFGAALLEEDD